MDGMVSQTHSDAVSHPLRTVDASRKKGNLELIERIKVVKV
jgi:hypothetical protein